MAKLCKCGEKALAKGLCRKCYDKAKYLANRTHCLELSKKWREANPEKARTSHDAWMLRNPEKVKEYGKRSRERIKQDPERSERQRQANKQRYENLPEEKKREMSKRASDYQKAHKDRYTARSRDRYHNDPEFNKRVKMNQARHRAKKRGAYSDGTIIKYFKHSELCAYCGKTVTFENTRHRTKSQATMDHIIPGGKGSHTIENVVTACWECNTSKNDRSLNYFLEKNFDRGEEIEIRDGKLGSHLDNTLAFILWRRVIVEGLRREGTLQ